MVTSDFRPEMEVRPFRACALKHMHYNPFYGRVDDIFVY